MKILKTFIFFMLFSFFSFVNADFEILETCKEEYKTKIEECIEAIWDWKNIKEFACPTTSISNDFVVMQVIMDQEFRKIDVEVDKYLSWIEKWKENFNTENVNLTVLEEGDFIFDVFWKWWYYWKKYNEVCSSTAENSASKQSLECISWIKPESLVFFTQKDIWKNSPCLDLAEFKLQNYEKVALHMLWIAKKQLSWDEFQWYKKEQKKKYEEVSKKITINLRLIDNLKNKWNDVTSAIFGN